jgi:hypothetical protein
MAGHTRDVFLAKMASLPHAAPKKARPEASTV